MDVKRLPLVLKTLAVLPLVPLCASLLLVSCSRGGATSVISDCGWDGEARAWLDKNRNGVWDSNEPPLPRVKFLIDDIRNHFTNVGREAVADGSGKAALSVWLPGCPEVEFEVYAEPPEGYVGTTPARVPAREKGFEFGFIKDK